MRKREEKGKQGEEGERKEKWEKSRKGKRETKEGRKGEGNQRENLKDKAAITPPLKAVKWHTNLHGYREVSLSLWGEEDIHRFLLEGLVALRRGPHFNDVQL